MSAAGTTAIPRLPLGFTLVELAVVMLIIGLILGLILTQTGLVNTGNAIHVTSVVQDLVKATGEFRTRYKFLPGDFPATTDDFSAPTSGVPAPTDPAYALYLLHLKCVNNSNGNGVVDAAETDCVAYHLFRANLIRAPTLVTKYGPVRVVSGASASPVPGEPYPTSVRNVIELCMIPGDVDATGKPIWGGIALDVDSKLDDGKFDEGSVRWIAEVVAGWCTNGGTNKVSLMSVALR